MQKREKNVFGEAWEPHHGAQGWVQLVKQVFSPFDMDGLLRQAGAERIDERASRKLGEILEDSAKQVMLRARVLAHYAGRKDITRDDIHLAAQMI